jgi:phage-related baseplate assembly protein
VSLRDVEDYARSVPGFEKAKATWLWDGSRRFVHLSVVGADGQPVDKLAIADLDTAQRKIGDSRLPLVVQAAEPVLVAVSARVVVDPTYDVATVLAAVNANLTTALGVATRALAQPLATGDVILAAHRVPGVVAVDVLTPAGDVPSLAARMDGSKPRPAQIVALAPGGLTLTGAVS